MATTQTFSFSQLVSNMATAAQGAATALLNFNVGSVLLAIVQAVAGVILWLQGIILQLLTLTRAATSQGTDLDSWMADYSFTRLPAVASTGQVTFSRFSATQQAVVPIGATVQSADGTQNFAVTVDTTNGAYSATLGGYVIAVNTASVSVPVQNTVGGTAGNVQSNTITVITSPISGVDTVTNSAGFINGVDAESDTAFRARFVLYIAGLSKATKVAIGSAIMGVQQGLNYTLTENFNYNGSANQGFLYAVIDDGTGHASSDLLARVYAAVDAVRACTISFAVFAPTIVTANVGMTLTSATGYTHANVIAAVSTALQNFINGLTLGTSLPYTQLASITYTVPGVTNATSILLNSATSDLAATVQQRIVAGTMTIS